MTRALVVGYGSIGARHARILAEMGCHVSILSRRPVVGYGTCQSLADTDADYVVIANETSCHMDSLHTLAKAGYSGAVLVEKPIADKWGALPNHCFSHSAVGYNLRFHPVVAKLREILADQRIVSAQIYCGQYLPDWRPGSDYRNSYSARREAGGGVLRDLSHEIDYMGWLFGAWRGLAALGGKLSELEIDSDDSWGILAEFERCPTATLQLNYLDRPGKREVVVLTTEHTYRADLMASTLTCDSGEAQEYPMQRDDMFRDQHAAMLEGRVNDLCSLEMGMDIMKFIGACERASATRQWERP